MSSQTNGVCVIKRLTIEKRPSYAENAGRYVAEVEYESKQGTLCVLLDCDVSGRLLEFVGPAIAEFSARAVEGIRANINHSLELGNALPVEQLVDGKGSSNE